MILRTISRNLLRSNRILPNKQVDYAVCIDIECTCDSPVQIQPMEVIEIACLKLNLVDQQPNDINATTANAPTPKSRASHLSELNSIERCNGFHSFVRPVINPNLTLFCQELTGVSQSMVDRSRTIEEVLNDLFDWLHEQQLIDLDYKPKEKFAFASCGNFDLSLLSPLVKEHKFKNHQELPVYFKEWINVKKTFVNERGEWPRGLYHMLEILGQTPSGRLHSAIDDCRNLARVIECLRSDRCRFQMTSRLKNP